MKIENYLVHSEIGNQGRFGNQLFQIAFLVGLYHNRDFRIKLLKDSENQHIIDIGRIENLYKPECAALLNILRESNINNFFKGFIDQCVNSKFKFSESSFAYNESFLDFSNYIEYDVKEVNNSYKTRIFQYSGYYQSPKYFNNCKDSIIHLFANPIVIQKYAGLGRLSECLLDINAKIDRSNYIKCALHIRRTDYVNDAGIHHNISIDNYIQIMEDFAKELKHPVVYVVYSDDIEWCRNELTKAKEHFIYWGLGRIDYPNIDIVFRIPYYDSELYDFYSMINDTDHIICANSSFSWWAGWLKKQLKPWAQVFLPDKWFKENGPKDTQDLYYEGSRTYIS